MKNHKTTKYDSHTTLSDSKIYILIHTAQWPMLYPTNGEQLNTLPCLHLRPINDIVYVDPYSPKRWEILS